MQVMRTVLEMAMESGPARLAMIVAAIAFTQVRIIIILECLCCLVLCCFGFTHVENFDLKHNFLATLVALHFTPVSR